MCSSHSLINQLVVIHNSNCTKDNKWSLIHSFIGEISLIMSIFKSKLAFFIIFVKTVMIKIWFKVDKGTTIFDARSSPLLITKAYCWCCCCCKCYCCCCCCCFLLLLVLIKFSYCLILTYLRQFWFSSHWAEIQIENICFQSFFQGCGLLLLAPINMILHFEKY